MTKPIRTYKDLLEEKERLKLLLSAQKELIRQVQVLQQQPGVGVRICAHAPVAVRRKLRQLRTQCAARVVRAGWEGWTA